MKIYELPEPYQSVAKKHRREDHDSECNNLAGAFDWSLTDEGEYFWRQCDAAGQVDELPCPPAEWICACGGDRSSYVSYMAGEVFDSTKVEKQVGGNHYKDMPITPRDYALANHEFLTWDEMNVIKYVSRHKNKNRKEDLEKAIHYIEMIIEENYDS